MNKGFYLQGAIDRERKESVAEWTYLMEQRQEWPLALRWVRVWGGRVRDIWAVKF